MSAPLPVSPADTTAAADRAAPDLAAPDLAAPDLAAPDRILHRLDWHVIRRLDGLLQGDYRTLFYGQGIDFADLREYQPPDDVRHIDWNVTARMNSPYVRQYLEDREITSWFLLDLSRSMRFGPPGRPKQMALVDLVTTLARLLTRNGNRVGGILYTNKIERTIPPRGGRNQVLRLTHELLRIADAPGQTASGPTVTDLRVLLDAGLNALKRRSLVIIVSDFFSEPGWERPLTLLNRRHELIGIQMRDPREAELPDAGLIVVEDSESGEQLTVDTSDPLFRRRFQEAAERHEAALQRKLARAGVDLHPLSTEEDLVGAIIRMAALRKSRRR